MTKPPAPATLGALVSDARLARNRTAEWLAVNADCSASWVARIERGTTIGTAGLVERIARALDIDAHPLILAWLRAKASDSGVALEMLDQNDQAGNLLEYVTWCESLQEVARDLVATLPAKWTLHWNIERETLDALDEIKELIQEEARRNLRVRALAHPPFATPVSLRDQALAEVGDLEDDE